MATATTSLPNYYPSAGDIRNPCNNSLMNMAVDGSLYSLEGKGKKDPVNPVVDHSNLYSLEATKFLMKAAISENLYSLRGIIKSLTKGNGDPSAVFRYNIDGFSVLHVAACFAKLDVCKYLVEELKGDVNAPGCVADTLGVTPFMVSAESGDVATVEYFLDRGGDLMKADGKGRTVLHHAVARGRCMVTEFLLSKGVPVNIHYGRGTPVFVAAQTENDKTLKILLDHGADPNIDVHCFGSPFLVALAKHSFKCMDALIEAGADVNWKTCGLTPLVFATARGGYTNCIQLLLEAGADANISDDLGRLPVQLAGRRDCKEEVEMLFPLTSPIPNVPNWSIEGVISYAKIKDKKPMEQRDVQRRNSFLKLQADVAFKQKDYEVASELYDMAINYGESATLYANRSVCKLLMGDGEGALSDATMCRMLRPDWAKACYHQAKAHMLLKEYEQACDAVLDAQKLDPGNADIEHEQCNARELMKNPPDEGEQ